MRERWFGATGRRVPEIALEGELDLEGALVLDDVSDDERLREAHAAGHAGRRPRGHARSGQGGARASRRSRACSSRRERADLLELDLTALTYG